MIIQKHYPEGQLICSYTKKNPQKLECDLRKTICCLRKYELLS